MSWLFKATAVVIVSSLPMAGAMADPIYGLPIDLLGATFSDGTALTGEFMLNVDGYFGGGARQRVDRSFNGAASADLTRSAAAHQSTWHPPLKRGKVESSRVPAAGECG